MQNRDKKKNKNEGNFEGPFLPSDTYECLKNIEIDNFYLKVNKTAIKDKKQNKFILNKTDNKGNILYVIKPEFDEDYINSIINRYKDFIDKSEISTVKFELQNTWRMVVGLGHESVYETSMILHHIYGIPYIPGSAVKGLTRNWVICEYFNEIEGNSGEGALADGNFCRIFGSPSNSALGDYKGEVVFFDAYPATSPDIAIDIMNPHFSRYYNNLEPPADYCEPNPIYFLTVKNTKFVFALGINSNIINEKISMGGKVDTILNHASNELINALSEYGIGAKTSSGYGIMK